MGIQPPSDLVLDVMQSADMARLREVTGKLKALASGAPGDFGAALAKAEAKTEATAEAKAESKAEAAEVLKTNPAVAAKAAALLPPGLAFSGTTLTGLRNAHALSQRPATAALPAPTEAAFKKFEAMVLSQFLDTMMPASEQSFGAGTAGGTWKSLLTEKLGAHVAEGGGIGIAARLARASAAFSAQGTKVGGVS